MQCFLSGQINCLGIYCCPFGLRSLTINKSVNCVRIHNNRTYLRDASSHTHHPCLMRNNSPSDRPMVGHYSYLRHGHGQLSSVAVSEAAGDGDKKMGIVASSSSSPPVNNYFSPGQLSLAARLTPQADTKSSLGDDI